MCLFDMMKLLKLFFEKYYFFSFQCNKTSQIHLILSLPQPWSLHAPLTSEVTVLFSGDATKKQDLRGSCRHSSLQARECICMVGTSYTILNFIKQAFNIPMKTECINFSFKWQFIDKHLAQPKQILTTCRFEYCPDIGNIVFNYVLSQLIFYLIFIGIFFSRDQYWDSQ